MFRLLLASLLLIKSCDAQVTVSPKYVGKIPSELSESSGLVITHNNLLWSHNDSGDDPILYGFDTSGQLLDTAYVSGAMNIDWEGLAYDRAGERLFVGDFGNNGNDRQDLKIYMFGWDGLQRTTPVRTLSYSYPDQTTFPANANFDMEGVFYLADSLYLFSKNKLFGGTGYSKIYQLPTDSGYHVATLLDSIQTGTPITGADISPDGKRVLLMSYGKMILFYNYPGPAFWKGDRLDIGIPLAQTEAVAFASNTELFFTNEQRNLFKVDIDQVLGTKGQEDDRGFMLYPNPSSGWAVLKGNSHFYGSCEIVGIEGQVLHSQPLDLEINQIQLANLPKGSFLLRVLNKNGQPIWTTHLNHF